MDSYDDKNLEVPLNMGCTGAAWQSKQQKFVLRKDFQQEAKHYLPESEWKKVWKDITWICSTPVFKNHQIIAVLNIDGDKNPGVEVQERIKRKGQSLADLLGDLV